jgi:Tol biopolymer transport system component
VPWRLVAQESPPQQTAQLHPNVNSTFTLRANTFKPNIPEEADRYVAPTGTVAARSDNLAGLIFAYAVIEIKTSEGATKHENGCIAIDPNTGQWQKISARALSVRVSPHGGRLALSEYAPGSPTPDDFPSIFLLDAQTPKPEKIIENCFTAVWSPDGNRLLYSRPKTAAGIGWRGPSWTYNLNSRKMEQTAIPETDHVADWSPNGDWLVTVSDRDPPFGRGYQLYVMHPDGTQQRRISDGTGLNVDPRFRPNSNQLLYVHQARDGNSLWMVDFDSSNRRQLLHGETLGESFEACWSPDGKWIAVSSLSYEVDAEGHFKMGGQTSQRRR